MVICKNGEDKIVGSAPLSNIAKDGIVKLTIKVEGLDTKGYAGDEYLGEAEVSNLSTEVAGGFVGCCIGLYASGNGQEGGYVAFKNLTYKKQA